MSNQHQLQSSFDSMELPDHLIYSILLNLPPKTLVRFRSLSKLWEQILTSSTFANQHLQLARQSTDSCCNVFLFARRFDEKYGTSVAETISYSFKYTQKIKPKCILMHSHIEAYPYYSPFFCRHCSCNGLLCVFKIGKNLENSSITVRNPAIGKHRKLEWPSFLDKPNEKGCFTFTGFGYEQNGDDYKIVIAVPVVMSQYIFQWNVHLFSLKENKWRTISSPILSSIYLYCFEHEMSSVAVNGNLFWIGCCSTLPRKSLIILKFNLAEEIFTFLPMPVVSEAMDVRKTLNFTHTTLNGLLYMFVWVSERLKPLFGSLRDRKTVSIDIWVLQGHTTWCKVATIPIKDFYIKTLSPVGFNLCGHVMMVDFSDGSLVVYIPRENRFVKVANSPRPCNIYEGLTDVTQRLGFHIVQMETLENP